MKPRHQQQPRGLTLTSRGWSAIRGMSWFDDRLTLAEALERLLDGAPITESEGDRLRAHVAQLRLPRAS